MEGLEDSSTNGNHEELWTEQEYNDIHGFTCAVKLDADKNLFLVTIVLNDTKIEVSRSYNAFYELNDYLRTSIEFSSHVETLPELPSSEAAYANCMVLENWLELVRVHMGEYLWNCRRLLCFLDDTMGTPNLKDCQLSNLRRKMAELTVAYRMLSMKLYNNEGALNDMVERLMYIEAQQSSINHHHQQQQQQQQDEDDHHYHHQQQQYLQQQQPPPPQSNLEPNHDHNSLSLVTGILGDILISVEDKANAANATTSTATSASNGVNHATNEDSDRKGVDVDIHNSPVDGSTSGEGVMNGKHHSDSVDMVSGQDTNGQGNGVEETGLLSQSNLTAPSQTVTESGEPSTAVVTPTTITTTTTETIIPAPVTATATTSTTTTTTTTGETDAAGMQGPDKGTEKAPDKASCLMNRALAALNSR